MCPTDSRKTKCILKGSHHQMLSHVKKNSYQLKKFTSKSSQRTEQPLHFQCRRSSGVSLTSARSLTHSTPENNRVQVTGCSFVGKVKTMMEEGYCALTGNGKLQLFKFLTLFVVLNPKCGIFRIFLWFRFYVKSILENVWFLKVSFCNLRGSQFCSISTIKKCKNPWKSNVWALKCAKMADLHFWNP